MKLSDYIAQFLVDQGIKHAFLISGGAIVHTADSVASHPDIDYICTQHEQGAGAAADAYSRVSENIGCALVTSGPGCTNLVTSVCNAYFDSIPVIFISGQVATFRIKQSRELRQKGFQETDVVSIFESITKYAKQVREPNQIKYELQKAIHMAKEGRPGPVLLDIPDDLQREDINPDELMSFVPEEKVNVVDGFMMQEFVGLIKSAERPVLILGAGIRVTKTREAAIRFAEHFHLPILLTWGGKDFLPHDHELNMGGLGVVGPRAGNFAAQNSDLVIGIGTRLSQMITGGKQNLFAPNAKKVMVDIDRAELTKFGPNDFKLDLSIEADLPDFFNACEYYYMHKQIDRFTQWRTQIKEWDAQYPICPASYYDREDRVDAHVAIKEISKASKPGDVIITDAGGNLSWTCQAFDIKKDQRLFSAWNHSPMGYSLPAAMGAALVSDQSIICIIGDGGLMMCLEELGTIRRYDMDVKIFLFNNESHGIQKQTMDTWLESRYVAVDHDSGLYFPHYERIANSFDIPYFKIANHNEISTFETVRNTEGPVFCNVEIVVDQKITPMLKFGAGLEDLDPKLPREEIERIMGTTKATEAVVGS